MVSSPLMIPIVAGITPAERRLFSRRCATSRLVGLGKPWAMTVDSKATTGLFAARALLISAEMFSLLCDIWCLNLHECLWTRRYRVSVLLRCLVWCVTFGV